MRMTSCEARQRRAPRSFRVAEPPQGGSGRLLLGLTLLLIVAVAILDGLADRAASELYDEGALGDGWLPLLPLLRTYLRCKAHVLSHAYVYVPLLMIVPLALFVLLRWCARNAASWREVLSGMRFRPHSYALANPFADAPEGAIVATRTAWARAVQENRDETRVVLGLDPARAPVLLSDRARSMHVHLLGQTGSGKTQSVIYPLLLQDAMRHRPVVFLDAKGSIENEEMLARIAAATGRSEELRIFTLNRDRRSQTYNPVYLTPSADPRAVAERVFSTFADEMDEPFYRMTQCEFFSHLVCALAATGKQICLRDALACLVDEDILFHALSQSSDASVRRQISAAISHMGDRYHQQVAGLRVALQRFADPRLNRYDPDIVLEDLLEGRGLVGFSLSANDYKFLARGVGIVVLQHLQQLGARRQQDRSLDQRPLYVFADEFYTFAYEGFVDAVNKLRDAQIALLLSHQSLADLDRISPEYARAIWDNTRNKIVLYESDEELCSRLAGTLGTRKNVERTIRRSADAYLNEASMLEASSRQVDEYILHPSAVKSLASVGQAYLIQTGTGDETAPPRRLFGRKNRPAPSARAVGVHLPLMGELPPAPFPVPKLPDESSGLGLWELVAGRPSSAETLAGDAGLAALANVGGS